jgi:uncharacterized protein YjbI with pentapeptide repeats
MRPDYSGKNLRGNCYRGEREALKGVNFSGADIRGVDFQNAILVETNFSRVRGGLTYPFLTILSITSLLFAVVSGLISGLASLQFVKAILNITGTTEFDQKLFIIMLGLLVILLGIAFIAVRHGWIVTLAVIMAVAWGVTWAADWALAETWTKDAAIVARAVGSFAWAVVASFAVIATSAAIAIGVGVIAVVMIWAGAMAVVIVATWNEAETELMVVAVAITLIAGYISWRTLREDEQFTLFRNFAIGFASIGTDFRNADLTQANFTEAILKHARFTKSTIRHTCWLGARELTLARLSGTILANPIVRELLTTNNGRRKSFVGLNLQGAYLVNADLTDSDLSWANLNGANLQGAKLINANLFGTQVLGVDFNGANLTGACLESWNIDSTTQLEGAHSDYVYLLADRQERRPSSGNFSEGEFSKLFKEVLNTVDFIFKNGIDWQAFLVSLEKLRIESGDTEISVQSIENKGDGVFVVKVNIPSDLNKEKVHREFKKDYDNQMKLMETRYKAQLEGKEEAIEIYRKQNIDLMQIITQRAQSPVQILEEVKIMHDKRRSIDVRGNLHIADSPNALNLGEIGGNVTKTIQQLPTSHDPDKPGLKELLIELQSLLEQARDEELQPEDKADAFQQVQMLAKAGTNPDERQKRRARSALRFFKGLVTELPHATKLAEELNKMISALAGFF